jgi:hypothetical protein
MAVMAVVMDRNKEKYQYLQLDPPIIPMVKKDE